MDADECLACAGVITRTGTAPGRMDDDEDEVPIGFCGICRTMQVRRRGVWLAVGRPKR